MARRIFCEVFPFTPVLLLRESTANKLEVLVYNPHLTTYGKPRDKNPFVGKTFFAPTQTIWVTQNKWENPWLTERRGGLSPIVTYPPTYDYKHTKNNIFNRLTCVRLNAFLS